MFEFNLIVYLMLFLKKVDTYQNTFISASDNGIINIWNMTSIVETIYRPVNFKSSELIGSNYLAAGAHNGEIYIWKCTNMSELKILKHNSQSINDLLLVNKTILVSASEDGSLKFWNTETFLELKYVNKAHDQGIKFLKIFNLTILMSISSDRVIKEWSLTDLNQISITQGICFSIIRSFDLFFNLNLIIGCDANTKVFSFYKVFLYNVLPETPTIILKALKYPYVACGLENGKIFILDIITKQLDYSFDAHNETITAIEYITDYILITGGTDCFIKIWNLTSKKLITEYKLDGRINDIILDLNFDEKIQLTTNEFTTQTSTDQITKNEVINLEFNTIKTHVHTNTTNPLNTEEYSTIYIELNTSFKEESSRNILLNILAQVNDNESNILEIFNLNKVFDLLKMDLDLNDCLTNCSNQGVCKYFKNINKYKCDCDVGFFGDSCNKDLNPCSSNPCLNDGVCTHISKSSFKCECSSNYYDGDFCEKEIDLCQNETCSSQGRCTVQNQKSKCICFKSFYGDKCQNESYELIVTKRIIKTASIIAIIVLVTFFLILILFDITNIFCPSKKKLRKRKSNIKK
ncbi:unnamed protein product [Brachionus calyciflorus]|uniref:EGF-like domain-containing protein n=1 Tax=Brachionus calyciflorus TaxID=104777 RepID=A0A814HN39_9BILA|nr:unnamed protein product [Brachionus calyciflorus]